VTCIITDFPTKHLSEIMKALFANPVGAVQRRIAFVEHLGAIVHHELSPAERAMIMIVVGQRLIRTMNKANSLEVFLLIPETPIIAFDHRAKDLTRYGLNFSVIFYGIIPSNPLGCLDAI